jgi:CHAT domain-containing protein/tetratricopeptide (TPR) repeat protein
VGGDFADRLLGLGRWAEARAAYEEYLAQHPDDVDRRAGYGIALLGTGDAAAAVRELSSVLERAPGQVDARYNRALAYAALDQDAEAVADLDLLIASQSEAWYLRSDRGGLLLRGGQVEEAVAELRKAVELAPEEPGPWLNLGSALIAAGELVEGHEYLSRAAAEGVPGAFTALRRARQQHLAQADRNEVYTAVANVLGARSAAEVAELARAAPYLLSDGLLDSLEEVLRSRPDELPANARPRVAELRRLAAGEDSSVPAGTTEQENYRRLADQQVLLYQHGDREEAARMAPALVKMARDVFGPDSAEHGLQLANQATFERREVPFREALDVLTRVAPELVPGVAANHAATQPGPEAAALLASALPYVDDSVPQDSAARVYSDLSARLLVLGQAQEAERTIREALESRRFSGTALARLLVALSEALFRQEAYIEAAELCERALDLYREAFGDTHEKVAEYMRGLGRIHARIGSTESARRWLVRAAEVWRRLDNPMQLALTQGDLATLYAGAGAQAAARRAAAEALRTLDPLRGLADPNEAEVLRRIRDAYHELDDLTELLAVQLRLAEVIPEAAELNNLGDVYYRSSCYAEAAHWYAEALSRAGPDTAFLARHNLANALYNLGRVDEGMAQHEQALAEMRVALPASDPRLLHTLVDLAGTLADIGQPGRAAELIAEARPHLGGALALQAKADALTRKLDLDHPGPGSAAEEYGLLIQQAQQARERRAYPEAERLIGQALEIVAEAYGPRHPEVAGLKLFLAAVRRDSGAVLGVEELIREALGIQEESLAPGDPVLITSRVELGTLLAETRRDEEASELLTSVVEHTEGTQTGRVLTALGLIAQRRGDFAAAERHLRRALDLAEEPGNQLAGRKNLVMLLIDQRRLADAHELAGQTLEKAIEWFGASDPRIGRALLIYVKAVREQGHYSDAEQLARRAVTLLGQAYPDDHADAANELGLALAGQGKQAEAEQWFQHAAVSVQGNPGRETTTLVNQAFIHAELGDFDRAISLVTKAAGLLEAALGSDAPEYGQVLAHLGRLQLSQENPTAAVDTLTKAYTILEASPGEQTSLAEPLLDLAGLYLRIGARDTSMAFAERALAITRDAYGPGHPALAPYLAALAQGKAFAGELDLAGRLFQDSLACHPGATEHLRAFAYFQAARGERDAALGTLEQLVEREDQMLAELTSSASAASEQRRRALLARLWTTVDAYLTLARPDDVHRAWELVVRRLGLEAEYLRSERAAALRGSGGHILQELGTVRAELARAVIAADTTKAESLRGRRDELERLLAGYLATGVEAPDAKTVAAALPADTTLVTYVLNEQIDFAHAALGKAPAARDGILPRPVTRYLAFVVTRERARLVDLGPAEPIAASLARLRELLIPDLAKERDLAGGDLRERLIDPLRLQDENLLIVAGGGLGLLPFQLLSLKSTDRLIDHYTISYLSAPRDLVRWTKPAQRRAGPPLVIADPDYDLGSGQRGTAMAPLPGTAQEGAEVASLLGTKALTGADAVKLSMTAARSPVVVHLATHGFFLPGPEPVPASDYYETLYTVTVPGEGVFFAGAEPVTQPDLTPAGLPRADADPMLRSAVALAGINTWLSGSAPPPEAGIGMLTADEVCTLDLRDTQMVVLSACETGLGDHRKNEGLVGLRWAFAVAGARALVTSLWRVPDRPTAELMKEFYAHVTNGMKIPDALRAAQLACRDRRPDPYYWSAFVAHGDPAATISRYRPIPRLRPRRT